MSQAQHKNMRLAIDPKEFIRHPNYKNTLRIALLLIAIQCIATILVRFEYKLIPPTQYFIIDSFNQVTPARGFDAPNFNLQQLLSWVRESTTDIFSLDFLSLDQQLEHAKKYFTAHGYDSFIDAVTKAHILSDIQQGKIILSSVPTGYPVVATESPTPGGGYQWTIQMPMRLSYQSANEVQYKDVIQEIQIKTVSTLDSPKGVGIERLRVIGSK